MDVDLPSDPITFDVQSVREVRLPISFDDREQIVEFYTQFVGLEPWPRSHQVPGALGVGPTRRGVLLRYAHDADADPMRRRLCLTTGSLARVERALRERGWMFDRCRSFCWGDSYLAFSDPSGHRIEIRESRRI